MVSDFNIEPGNRVGGGWILQFSSVAQSCLTMYDPMDCNMPGFFVHHYLLELTQSHVH